MPIYAVPTKRRFDGLPARVDHVRLRQQRFLHVEHSPLSRTGSSLNIKTKRQILDGSPEDGHWLKATQEGVPIAHTTTPGVVLYIRLGQAVNLH